MAPCQFLHSLFVLFHIENREKSLFAYEVNKNYIEYHEYLEDKGEQAFEEGEVEEYKKSEQEKLGYYRKCLFS